MHRLASVHSLSERLGEANLRRRLGREARVRAGEIGEMGRLDPLVALAGVGLRALGFYRRGVANALDFEVLERPAPIRHLPPPLAGFRLLHLSDLHIDGHLGLVEALRRAVEPLAFDACVITGDFRFVVRHGTEDVIARTSLLARSLRCAHGVFAVLGNHDFVEIVPPLEAAGIRFLLNENVPLGRGGGTVWLCGIDDAHFYKTYDLARAHEGVPASAPSILLSHTPEAAAAASAARRPELFLCGHTHGGQICLPGGWIVYQNARCSRRLLSGAWCTGGMPGYTSRGVGTSGLPLRFHCRPEIVVHTLVPAGVHVERARDAALPAGRSSPGAA